MTIRIAMFPDDEDKPQEEQPADAAKPAGDADAESPEVSEEARDAKAEAEANKNTPQSGYYRILVVEDARILRKMLVKILHDAGHVCDEAGHGHEGLAFMRRSKSMNHPYDLIITDLMMPEMDGWEFIDNLIEKKFYPGIPVIIITANATLDSVKRSGRLGIKNFIVKPFDSGRVLQTVQKAMRRGAPSA